MRVIGGSGRFMTKEWILLNIKIDDFRTSQIATSPLARKSGGRFDDFRTPPNWTFEPYFLGFRNSSLGPCCSPRRCELSQLGVCSRSVESPPLLSVCSQPAACLRRARSQRSRSRFASDQGVSSTAAVCVFADSSWRVHRVAHTV